MRHIDEFHKSYEQLWEYRLRNMEMLTTDMHQIILTLSICDFDLKRNNVIEPRDYDYIKERILRSRDFIIEHTVLENNLGICLELLEAFVIMEKFNELGN